MGIGIWSMHFVGMLAFHLGVPLAYDVPTTLVSLLPAVGSPRRRSRQFVAAMLAGAP